MAIFNSYVKLPEGINTIHYIATLSKYTLQENMIPGHILTVAILAMFLFVWIITCPCFNPSIPWRTVRSRP